VDDDAVSNGEIRYDRAAKLAAVAIDARIDGAENFYVQDRSLGKEVERISVRMAKTGLQVKGQNRSWQDAEGFNGGSRNLCRSSSGEQTGDKQEQGKKSRHGLGLSSEENKRH
jgi:hypothetical protein